MNTEITRDGRRWISHEQGGGSSSVTGYILDFAAVATTTKRIHVAADQQYQLYLDGVFVGRSQESGTPRLWYYDTYSLKIDSGHHTLSALVWSWEGETSAMFQMTLAPGFILMSVDPLDRQLLDTGHAPWRSKALSGINFTEHATCPNGWIGVPPSQTLNAIDFPWDWPSGKGEGWTASRIISGDNESSGDRRESQELLPSTIPLLFKQKIISGRVRYVSDHLSQDVAVQSDSDRNEEQHRFENLLRGEAITLPPYTKRRVIIDLEEYYCAYPEIECSDGRECRIRLTWAESLFCHAHGMEKGQRDQVTGKYFRGVWDEFILDGTSHRKLETLTWRAGRFLEVTIENAGEPVTIENFCLTETRFPLENKQSFDSDNPSLNEILPMMVRTLQVSAHENFVDCPFYERLLYSGDVRLEALTAYSGWGDDRLARKAISLFASSCEANGMCMARWPSHMPLYIPSFSLWWVCTIHDFARWRSDREFVRSVLPQMRSTIEFFISHIGSDDLVTGEPSMWNFIDWVPEWQDHPWGGAPPGSQGKHCLLNLLLIYTLQRAAEIESYAGEAGLAAKFQSIAERNASAVQNSFWNPDRGLYNDDIQGVHYSEHSQIMAVLNGGWKQEAARDLLRRSLATKELARTSLFFSHYLFEAGFLAGEEAIFFERLDRWSDFTKRGFRTTPENFEDARSDCHGWGAHPIYHVLANIAGIQPAAMGFERALIRPRLGPLRELRVTCCHPAGEIRAYYKNEEDRLISKINLPPGVSGEFHSHAEVHPLKPGWQVIETKNPFP